MRVGEIWIDKEDGEEVKILELNEGSGREDEVLYSILTHDQLVTNYLFRKEFLEHYRKKC